MIFVYDTTRMKFAGRIAVAVFAVIVASSSFVFSQDVPTDIVAPPEMKISKSETEQLEKESDVKRRTTLSLLLMETRVIRAESLVTNNSFDASLTELGGFGALLDDAVKFLNKNDNGTGKIRNSQKKIEVALRKYSARFETIRRAMPFKYGDHVKKLIKVVREARTKLIEPFFDDTVVKTKQV